MGEGRRGFYMLNFEIKPSVIAGFSCYWAWVWIVFWSALFYDRAPSGVFFGVAALDSLGTLWCMSLLCMSATLLGLYALSKRRASLGSSALCIVMAAAPTALGTVLVAMPGVLFSPDIVLSAYAFGAAMIGVGSAFEFVLWGELLTLLGARQSIVYFVSSTVLSVVVFALVTCMEAMVAMIVTALLPVFGMVLFRLQFSFGKSPHDMVKAVKQSDVQQFSEHALRAALVELGGIALFFGVSYGVMKGLFIFENAGTVLMRYQLNAIALIVGSVAIFLTMGVFRMDFRRMTYQIALPLMAAGFVLLPAGYPYSLMGFFLHQMGYQYFYAVIWAMWPVLAARTYAARARFVCAALFGVQFGQLLGSCIGSALMGAIPSLDALGIIAPACIFVILLVALFCFGNASSDSAWIMTRPFDHLEEKQSKFKQSLEVLASSRGLSAREAEVFALLAKGRNKQAIASQLCVSENTAKTHIRNVYRKLGVHSQQAMIDMVELDATGR